jgi:hypothetical protein
VLNGEVGSLVKAGRNVDRYADHVGELLFTNRKFFKAPDLPHAM